MSNLWISFAWTTPALVAGHKTVTRRDWSPAHSARFKAGCEVLAYDQQPRFHGNPVAVIRMTCDAYREADRIAPDSDYLAEGFGFLHALALVQPERLPKRTLADLRDGAWTREAFAAWRTDSPGTSDVIRFEVLRVLVRLDQILGGRAPRAA